MSASLAQRQAFWDSLADVNVGLSPNLNKLVEAHLAGTLTRSEFVNQWSHLYAFGGTTADGKKIQSIVEINYHADVLNGTFHGTFEDYLLLRAEQRLQGSFGDAYELMEFKGNTAEQARLSTAGSILSAARADGKIEAQEDYQILFAVRADKACEAGSPQWLRWWYGGSNAWSRIKRPTV